MGSSRPTSVPPSPPIPRPGMAATPGAFALGGSGVAGAAVGGRGGEAAGASVDAYNYFDGKILSCYLISSGNFVHPVSRRPLARAECERLDTYMQLHGLCNAGVTHVFDLKADTSGGRMPLVPRARACPAPASSSASRVRAYQEPACWPACGPRGAGL